MNGDVARVNHWLGQDFAGMSARTAPVTNPATGAVTAEVVLASTDDVNRVVEVAGAAFPAWRDTSVARRTQVLFAFRELLNTCKGELAELITDEHGKVLSDAAGEVSRGQEVVELACGIAQLLHGSVSENAATGIDVSTLRQPLGPVAVISPFNFPAMVPLWFIPVAIAAGNTVVLKPSEKDPSASIWLARLWAEAGLPAGVFNVVQGDAEAVDALLTHPAIEAVSFVGSTHVARHVYETAALSGKRVQALGGAKNHMIVLPDADLDAAADAAVSAAYGSAGERCMAISVVVTVGPIADDLVARIADRTHGLTVGSGRRDVDMGPLVTREHRDRVASYVDAAEAQGGKLVVDGRDWDVDGEATGFWLGPTLVDHVTPEMSVYRDEVFGPVLAVVRADSFDEALDLVNANSYGNGTALFTTSGPAARRFQTEVQVGMVGINVPVPVPVAHHSFGGWKSSLFGDTHAHGAEGVRFYTRAKVVTSRWGLPSGGVQLGFPQNT